MNSCIYIECVSKIADMNRQNQNPLSETTKSTTKDMEGFSIGGWIILFALSLFLTPIAGFVAYLFFASSAPVKARQSAIAAIVTLVLYMVVALFAYSIVFMTLFQPRF